MDDLDRDLIELMAEGNSPPVHLDFDELFTPMAAEIRRHRAAVRADRERVEMVVHEILNVTLTDKEPRWSITKHQQVCGLIADRVADALASPAPANRALIAEVGTLRSQLAGSTCTIPSRHVFNPGRPTCACGALPVGVGIVTPARCHVVNGQMVHVSMGVGERCMCGLTQDGGQKP